MPSQSTKILVVDDNPDIADLYASILSDAGYEVICAANGKKAVEQLGSAHFDLLVTDLVMPEKEGLELIRECKKIRPELKIIAVSGSLDGQFLRMAKLFGAHEALLKPFRPETLIQAVLTVLEAD